MRKPRISIQENILDKTIETLAPGWAASRRKARLQLAATNSYVGADQNKRWLKNWKAGNKSANSEVEGQRQTLRERSRDLYRNNPLARGAINTKVSNIVGTGLKLQPCIDHVALGVTEEQAAEWEKITKREFHCWAKSKDCDITRTNNFYEIQALAHRSELVNGDALCLLPMKKVDSLPYSTRIQLVEADRLSNPNFGQDTETLVGGVQMDEYGAPVAYHIANYHPGEMVRNKKMEWTRIPAFSSTTGRRNVIHLYQKERIGQTRGIPDLTPVIEPLKQLGDFTEAELEAAAVSAMFAIFVTTEGGEGLAPVEPTEETGASSSDTDFKVNPGMLVDLAPGEKVETAQSNRPNANFDPFVLAILRQIGMGLGLPYEILIKHFTASYSAARAAMLEAWRYFATERESLAVNFCQPIYEAWMWEAVASGRITAPGFLVDPAVRAAYLNAVWNGPARGQIDELKEANAAKIWLDLGVKTLEQVTREETGMDWEGNQRQRTKEITMRRGAGLEMDPAKILADKQKVQQNGSDKPDKNQNENQ
jgi:lambda family phage portal protein